MKRRRAKGIGRFFTATSKKPKFKPLSKPSKSFSKPLKAMPKEPKTLPNSEDISEKFEKTKPIPTPTPEKAARAKFKSNFQATNSKVTTSRKKRKGIKSFFAASPRRKKLHK
eukprot:1382399-Amorphochlora_amoeboformis.AAC.1